ncbi:MAG: 30S ribosomal protein S3, partial [Rhodospirillales bacterium]|nr:30S ribosomal protein S3 [Rhodospirillales bacterium]
MGQKVNPIGLRLGINKTWDSRWFADRKEYAKRLHEDLAIRKYLTDRLRQAGVAKIIIERPAKRAR